MIGKCQSLDRTDIEGGKTTETSGSWLR